MRKHLKKSLQWKSLMFYGNQHKKKKKKKIVQERTTSTSDTISCIWLYGGTRNQLKLSIQFYVLFGFKSSIKNRTIENGNKSYHAFG